MNNTTNPEDTLQTKLSEAANPDTVPAGHDMPLPSEPKTVYLAVLCLIAVVSCLNIAQEIVIPVALAFVLKLLLQPLVRLLERARFPKALGALAAITALLSVFAGLGALLSTPAAQWAANLPQTWPILEQKFAFIKQPINHLSDTLERMGVHLGRSETLLANPAGMITAVFSGTGSVAAHLLETLLVLFYLLVFGETFLRRLVEVLPDFSEKKQAVELFVHVERDLSAYLLTVTAINTAVGIATAIIMWALGVSGAILWGVTAFCLNFVPILGPFVGVVLFLGVGLVSFGPAWRAILPAVLYFGVHIAEGELITPMLLARRFTINPAAVILSLIFWYWMWGVAGAVLAVPLLAISKIMFDRLAPFRAIGHLLEG